MEQPRLPDGTDPKDIFATIVGIPSLFGNTPDRIRFRLQATHALKHQEAKDWITFYDWIREEQRLRKEQAAKEWKLKQLLMPKRRR